MHPPCTHHPPPTNPSDDGEIDFNEFLGHFGEALAGGSDKDGISNQLGASHLRRDLRPVHHPYWTPAKVKAVISEAFSLSSKSVRKTFMRYDHARLELRINNSDTSMYIGLGPIHRVI